MRFKGDQSTTRAINRRMVLDLLHREGSLSRRDLCARTGLSAGSVTTLIQELLEEGLVLEGEAQESSGGRKPVPIFINYAARLSIGVKLMEAGISASLTDLSCKVLRQVEIPLSDMSPDSVAAEIASVVSILAPDSEARQRLIGVGLAMPGFVDTGRGVVVSSHRFGWKNVPIASMIAAKLSTAVWVDNDVNAYAIAQQLFGLAGNARSVLTIILGTGVGAAMIIDGKINRGGHFRGGEIGFFPLRNQAGKSLGDCFSLSALCEEWSLKKLPGTLPEAASMNEPEAIAFLKEKAQDIGELIAFLVLFMDPAVVVIGGETIQLSPRYRTFIEDAFSSMMVEPRPAMLFDEQNDLWTRGAAVLAIDHWFDFERVGGVTK